jgi:hypothetical protein
MVFSPFLSFLDDFPYLIFCYTTLVLDPSIIVTLCTVTVMIVGL